MKHVPDRPYCQDFFSWSRRETRPVYVGKGPRGDVWIGGTHPVCVQSMTTTGTRDIEGTVDQVERLVETGCDLVRITAPTVKDSHCLGEIREGLDRRGIVVPLVADIHFQPAAAEAAADYVEKVRINPGNFADKKVFKFKDYTEADYNAELERIEERFLPLLGKLIRLKRCLRIGTNHGSLSDRILGHYGDTPEGMVESALEFVRICEKHEYHDIVLSMKASSPPVMIEANRLLVARMADYGMTYPIHLGVTEAGDGEDGRIKSAVGIGSLLNDGIGDTIRVSLTEDPENEIPVARQLVEETGGARVNDPAASGHFKESTPGLDPYQFTRRRTCRQETGPVALGGEEPVRVECLLMPEEVSEETLSSLTECPEDAQPELLTLRLKETSDRKALAALKSWRDTHLPQVGICAEFSEGLSVEDEDRALADECCSHNPSADESAESTLSLQVIDPGTDWASSLVSHLDDPRVRRVVVSSPGLLTASRFIHAATVKEGQGIPVSLRAGIHGDRDIMLRAAAEMGAMLCDGIGDTVAVISDDLDPAERVAMAYSILQATGRRITRTDYVACPSCGRTLFDLQSTTERIRSKTSHLKGVRIAIMGCIVNGPGEMADADFGYVGSSAGQISLYVGRDCVTRNIPEEDADQRLIELIQEHGRWVEPPAADS